MKAEIEREGVRLYPETRAEQHALDEWLMSGGDYRRGLAMKAGPQTSECPMGSFLLEAYPVE